ncbi:hypothetical protein NEOLEDRAFT_724369 [Neolentinus lepideus HHB14362 ss-1]|uniref:Uncharacterized protein n=1 Tax=Neolentinus lepideus HHB14362 ss-1 TaxID=1314782 RepID=A0A165Q3K2_9AGAM|nr:hypothetical protein NEOLEDRAFT_724369 [Neolentinus lepideus HHB14362 ss-1]
MHVPPHQIHVLINTQHLYLHTQPAVPYIEDICYVSTRFCPSRFVYPTQRCTTQCPMFMVWSRLSSPSARQCIVSPVPASMTEYRGRTITISLSRVLNRSLFVVADFSSAVVYVSLLFDRDAGDMFRRCRMTIVCHMLPVIDNA